jgi:hypothetical protein
MDNASFRKFPHVPHDYGQRFLHIALPIALFARPQSFRLTAKARLR